MVREGNPSWTAARARAISACDQILHVSWQPPKSSVLRAEAATISERDRVADILRDLDRVRAEALQAAEALRAIEAYQHARLRAAWRGE